MRLALALVFIGTSVVLTVQGQWGAGGLSLLIGAVILPNYAKRQKMPGKGAGPPRRHPRNGADRVRR